MINIVLIYLIVPFVNPHYLREATTKQTTSNICSWTNIDSCKQPQQDKMFAILQRDSIMFKSVSSNAFDMLHPIPGQTILDVGCGLGLDAITFAEKGSKVIGLDASKTAISKAWNNVALHKHKDTSNNNKNQHRQLSGQSTSTPLLNILFQQGLIQDVVSLFGTLSFDGIHVSRVLEHVDDPRESLRRLSSILKHGGRIVVAEPDWQTLTIVGLVFSIDPNTIAFVTY